MEPKKVKIFFDGNCIVCDTEIAHYYRIAPQTFEMIDISAPEFNADSYGLKFDDVNANMHIQTETGEFKIGVDAFAYVWSKIPRYRVAQKLIQLPGVYSLAKVGYSIFAKNRHRFPKKNKQK